MGLGSRPVADLGLAAEIWSDQSPLARFCFCLLTCCQPSCRIELLDMHFMGSSHSALLFLHACSLWLPHMLHCSLPMTPLERLTLLHRRLLPSAAGQLPAACIFNKPQTLNQLQQSPILSPILLFAAGAAALH